MNNNLLRIVLAVLFVAYCIVQVSWGYRIADFDMQTFGKAFVIFSAALCSLLAIDFYHKKILDRFQMATSVFGVVGTIAFLGNVSSLLYYYDNYTRVLFFVSIFAVGLITTFFTKAGFIGVISDDKKAVTVASVKLLVLSSIAVFWTSYVKHPWDSELIFSVILPLNFMEWACHYWRRQISGEQKSGWKFKW